MEKTIDGAIATLLELRDNMNVENIDVSRYAHDDGSDSFSVSVICREKKVATVDKLVQSFRKPHTQ